MDGWRAARALVAAARTALLGFGQRLRAAIVDPRPVAEVWRRPADANAVSVRLVALSKVRRMERRGRLPALRRGHHGPQLVGLRRPDVRSSGGS